MPATTNDNTAVQTGGAGDVLRTDAVTEDDGSVVKTPIVKLGISAPNEPARLVAEGANALPVHDRAVLMLLTEILQVLKEILATLRRRRG